MVEKSLDVKLAKIHADPFNNKEFIIADAKDADVAYGVACTGRRSPEYHHGEVKFNSIQEYREMMREVTRQGLVDIMLMSPSTNEVLTIQEQFFKGSSVTPAGRCNDTSDIFVMRGSSYTSMYSLPHRSALLDQLQCGKIECKPEERVLGANLGLYSVTFNNDAERDVRTLEAYKAFRIEAEQKNFRYFLEVFNPNVADRVDEDKVPGFIVDSIIRTMSGVTEAQYPAFLKMVYQGPKATEELFNFNPHLVIGILGGSAGTTYDAFKLVAEAQKYGARAALFGRKINNAENQLAFIKTLRLIVEGQVTPEEAVKVYHSVIANLGLKPHRPLEEDSQLTTQVMSYGEGSSTVTVPANVPPKPAAQAAPAPKPAPTPAAPAPAKPRYFDEKNPDFSKMTADEKIEFNQRERDRIFG